MQDTDPGRDAGLAARRPPRRDYVLLPLVSLMTVIIGLGGAELAARAAYEDGPLDACLVHDEALGFRYKANCESRLKLPETGWVTNHFNECGFRTKDSCGPKPANTLRVALLGSSMGFGLYVPYEQSTSAVLASDLTARCGRPVEVQNLASEFEFGDVLQRRFPLALQLRPDALVLVAGPTDLMSDSLNPNSAQNALPPVELLTRIRNVFVDLRLRIVAQHLMYQNTGFYLSLYRNSVAKTVYMRDPLLPGLRSRVEAYGDLLAMLRIQAGSAAPVVVAYVPQRAQVGFAAEPDHPATIDPFALNHALGEAAAKAGVVYVDTTPDFVADARQMDLFLRSDGHLASGGDGVVGHSIARRMVQELPAFRGCSLHTSNDQTWSNQ